MIPYYPEVWLANSWILVKIISSKFLIIPFPLRSLYFQFFVYWIGLVMALWATRTLLSYSSTDLGIPPHIFQYYISSYWNPTVFNLALLKRTIPASREFNSLIAAMLKLRLYIAIATPRVNRLVTTLPYRSYRPLTTHSATRLNLPPVAKFRNFSHFIPIVYIFKTHKIKPQFLPFFHLSDFTSENVLNIVWVMNFKINTSRQLLLSFLSSHFSRTLTSSFFLLSHFSSENLLNIMWVMYLVMYFKINTSGHLSYHFLLLTSHAL